MEASIGEKRKAVKQAEKTRGNKMKDGNHQKVLSRFLILCFSITSCFFLLSPGVSGQEVNADAILSQADVLYVQGNYQEARRLYLEAARLTDRSLIVSRGFFGAALCSFYLGEEAATRNYLQRVFAVDANKEISALFYPPAFLQLFNDVKKKYLAGELKAELSEEEKEKSDSLTAKKQETGRVEKQAAVPTETKTSLGRGQTSHQASVDSSERKPVVVAPRKRYFLGGYWEIEVHYGRWGLEPALSLFKKTLTKKIGSEVRQEITDYLSSRYGKLVQSAYSQELSLSVEGSNEGVGIRYYSQGEKGTFSLGFSLERTHLRIETTGSLRQSFDNGSLAEVSASAHVLADPLCGHLSFRWDFVPLGRFSPCFTLGLGFGPLNGKMGYSYAGTYSFYNYQESIRDSKEKSLEEWRQEQGSYFSLKNFVLLQLSLGLRVEVFRGLLFQFEGGVWDGFLLRAGLAFRL